MSFIINITNALTIEMNPKIICLTPIRNEAWILDRFLKAASLWADYIIIADQMSTDGSREIVQKYSKVILIDNPSESFNEPERQKLLIDEARKIDGPRLLITLDADEILTPNVLKSPEWHTILTSKPGTIFKFQLANFRPDMKNMWLANHFPWGYMDDGCQHSSDSKIHSGRIPLPAKHDEIVLNLIKVIHFQYVDWARMQSKHRWYQCFERINFPEKSSLDIFRRYHHMYVIPKNQIIPIPNKWIQEYNNLGIDISSIYHETMLWWDQKVLEFMELYGTKKFKNLHIWDIDWENIAMLWGKKNIEVYKDPRTRLDKYINKWLIKTQKDHNKWIFQKVDKIIRCVFKN